MKPYQNDLFRRRLFNSYRNIRQCCYNPNNDLNQAWQRQGLEITCEFTSFNDFYQYVVTKLGPQPGPESRIIRRDMSRSFEPGNLEWGDYSTQQRRQRRCVRISYRRRSQCLTAWCEELGVNYYTVLKRLERGVRRPGDLFRVRS